MRKLAIAISTAAAILGAAVGSFLLAAPVPLVSPTSGCGEASQLLNCLNSAVVNVLRGNGQTAPLSVGSYGTVSGAAPGALVLNTQGGVASFTGLTVAGSAVSAAQTITNNLVTASSSCFATLQGSGAAGSAPFVANVTPSAGSLAVLIGNGTATTTGSFTANVGFWCNN